MSLHTTSAGLWWQVLLFVIADAFAMGLLAGSRSELMAAFSWLLLISLLNRKGLYYKRRSVTGDPMLLEPIPADWCASQFLYPKILDHRGAVPWVILPLVDCNSDPLEDKIDSGWATAGAIFFYVITVHNIPVMPGLGKYRFKTR